MARKVVITNLDFGQDYTELISNMAASGYDMVWTPTSNYTPQETVRLVKGYDAVIAGGEKYDRYALEQLADSLKIILRHGTGIDNIDIEAASDFGIAVTNAPGKNALAVAEHALGMMLCLTRKINRFDSEMHRGVWHPHQSKQLYNKTVGIIGFGAIGRWLATLLAGFQCKVLAYDKYQDASLAASTGAEYASIDEILGQSDFVSLHVPLTPETQNSIGMDFFSKMKSDAVFVNTSRGKTVREEYLIKALQDGVISGACLDVFANAPIDASNPLCSMDNVILSPHTSAVTEESMEDMMQCNLSDMMDFFAGKTLKYLLNPDYASAKK